MENKKVVIGFDAGINSLGYAVILETDYKKEIIKSGVLIPNIDGGKKTEYENGSGSGSNNVKRRDKRGMRRLIQRKQKRTKILKKVLNDLGILPQYPNYTEYLTIKDSTDIIVPKNIKSNLEFTIHLRYKAITQQLSEKELGLVFLFLNQRRGFSFELTTSKINDNEEGETSEENKRKKEDNKKVKFKDVLKNTQEKLENKTIAEFLYSELQNKTKHEKSHYVIRNNKYSRDVYKNEFDLICEKQKEFHPTILNNDNIKKIRHTIYFQRPLKSQKKLVALDGNTQKTKTIDNYLSVIQGRKKKKNQKFSKKIINIGCKVANITNPFYELFRLYSKVNDIRVKDEDSNIKRELTKDEKKILINKLLMVDKLSNQDLLNLFGNKLKFDKSVETKLHGFKFVHLVRTTLEGYDDSIINNLLKYDISKLDNSGFLPNHIIKYNIYELWHILYSIPVIDKDSGTLKIKTLMDKFKITEDIAQKLITITFDSKDFTDVSLNTIKKTLPKLIEGKNFTIACQEVGIKNEGSLTKEEIENKIFLNELPLLQKGDLRQPVVEKIVNLFINKNNELFNKIREEHGNVKIEYRIETARELTKSKKVRNQIFKKQRDKEKNNNRIIDEIKSLGKIVTNKNILKYKLWEETDVCLYTGEKIPKEKIFDYEVEHIIPKSKSFDNNINNFTLCLGNINQEKNNTNAYDYVKSKGDKNLVKYVSLVEKLYKEGKINEIKYNNLLLTETDLESHFTEKNKTQFGYISNKIVQLLTQCSPNVERVNGLTTAYLRKIWDYDNVIYELIKDRDESYSKDNYNKRDDYRNHELDAIIFSCAPKEIKAFMNTYGDKKGNLIKKYIENLMALDLGEIKKEKQLSKEGKEVTVNYFVYKNGEKIRYGDNEDLIYKVYFKATLTKPFSDDDIKTLLRKSIVKFNNNKQKRGELHDPLPLGLKIIEVNDKEMEVETKRYKIGKLPVKDFDDKLNQNNLALLKLKEYIKFFNLKPNKGKYEFNKDGNQPCIDTIFNNNKIVKQGTIPIKSINFNSKKSDGLLMIKSFDGKKDFIKYFKTSNNFNAIIYKNNDTGDVEEKVVRLIDKVNKNYKLPYNIEVLYKFKINDYFYMNFDKVENFKDVIRDAEQTNDLLTLSKYLFKVKSTSETDYKFIHHTESRSIDTSKNKNCYQRIQSLKHINENRIIAVNKLVLI